MLSVPAVCGLRLTRVSVPAFRKKGESALLECKYELKKLHNLRTQHHDQNAEVADGELDEDEDEHQEEVDTEEALERHRQQHQQRRTQATAMTGRGHRRAEEFVGSKFYETSEALYSVKWYKDNEEFYRYLPKSNPPQHSYRVEGIRVDVSIRFHGIGGNQQANKDEDIIPTTPRQHIPEIPYPIHLIGNNRRIGWST